MITKTTDQTLRLLQEWRLDGTELDGLELECPHHNCWTTIYGRDLEYPATLREVLRAMLNHENTQHPDVIAV